MNDGGYSRLEKDFLGNERMVHYDASGNMLGASDVIREPDGTIRVTNDPVSSSSESELPKVEAIPPTPRITNPEPNVTQASVSHKLDFGGNRNKGMPANQVVMYSIAAFVTTLLVTLGVLAVVRSNGPDAQIRTSSPTTQMPSSQRNVDPIPDSQPEPDNFPPEPRPRNDDQPGNARPFDESAPDSNMDDSRPRIRDNNPDNPVGGDPKGQGKPKKGGSDDPIDLRGDEGGTKEPPTKGDPTGDPLRGDDIH